MQSLGKVSVIEEELSEFLLHQAFLLPWAIHATLRRSASFNSSSHPYFIRFKFCRMILPLIESGRRSPHGSETENAWLKIFLFVVPGSSFSQVNCSISSCAFQMTPKVLSVGNLSSLSSRYRGDLSCSGMVAKTSGSFVSHLCSRKPPRRSNSASSFHLLPHFNSFLARICRW